MPFAEEVRAELTEALPAAEHCRLALLSGIVRHAGSLRLHGGGSLDVACDLASSATARRTVALLRERGASCEVRTYQERRFARRTRFQVLVSGDARTLQVLNEAGVLTSSLAPAERVPRRLVARACCRRAYLRGAFLAAGSISGPRAAKHVEWRVSSPEAAGELQELAAEEGFELGVHDRRRFAIAYSKRSDTIRGLLAALGAHGAELRLEEDQVLRWTRERANRLTNADAGNLRRQSEAAARQIAAIDALGGPAALPPSLRRLAELRAQMPDATYEELGRACVPPLGKAAVAGRLRRLVALADA